ncbi:YjbH domain-containing protein [Paraburkholderia phenazinium]|uniref:Exopolysaccharide biosynthesis protein YbjH n=1 Tax=Paraburkholderia phenazinium TaxID=60549 RepID=A0A1G7QBC0_9BURK|nr:YjbH domain-containing protein [Paraburkholderia phenazinium]SDF95793.1 Exopolysaccharide biosynthesis protein YbjH [Paraburkholderia phenazinium]
MLRRLPAQQPQLTPKAVALGAALVFSVSAHAVDPALNALGQAGGLVIPYGFTLPSGVGEAQYNDYLDPRYGNEATGSQIYWGAFGLFPYVEVSGGLANYPGNVPAPFSGADHFILRHLMADVKVEVPQFFKYQPDIAFGVTDVGGQSHFFRSKYGVVSQALGPATLTVGYGQGDRLDGVFGGVQLSLWNTGLSLLAEDDAKTPYAGVRYQSPAISWLADASLVGTLMGSVRKTDGVSPRASVSIGVQIPLGKRFSPQRCAEPRCKDNPAETTATADDGSDVRAIALRNLPPLDMTSAAANGDGLAGEAISYVPPLQSYASVVVSEAPSPVPGASTPAVPQALDTSALETIAHQLVAAGLERVRVGISGRDLIVEYENHRYNQNEADALGIVLGVATVNAPHGIERIRAVIKKANEPIAEVSVDRSAYAQFVAGGAPGPASGSLTMSMRPTYDADSIAWVGDAHSHGFSRIQIKPVTSYLYGTEYGNFDFSLRADVEAFVPLWRGAELYGSYIAPIYNTRNMDDGRVFSEYRLHGGLSTAALAQSFWVMPQVFNVAAVGKFDYDYLGAENETTVFVPGRPDLVRLKLAYLHQEPGHETLPDEKNAVLTYRWVQPAWNMWIEAGVARYVGGDKGPLITLTRWFDDVSVSVSAEHSGQGSFVGAAISFPLTPRQGMKPGISQLDGTGQFALDFRTRVSSRNYLNTVAAENLDFPYSTQQYLLNQGRFSAEYFATQLYRMRDAYVRYARPDGDAPTP